MIKVCIRNIIPNFYFLSENDCLVSRAMFYGPRSCAKSVSFLRHSIVSCLTAATYFLCCSTKVTSCRLRASLLLFSSAQRFSTCKIYLNLHETVLLIILVHNLQKSYLGFISLNAFNNCFKLLQELFFTTCRSHCSGRKIKIVTKTIFSNWNFRIT